MSKQQLWCTFPRTCRSTTTFSLPLKNGEEAFASVHQQQKLATRPSQASLTPKQNPSVSKGKKETKLVEPLAICFPYYYPSYLRLRQSWVSHLLLEAPRLVPSLVKGFSSMKAYTRDLNFWASSARSFAIRVWGSRFATSIVQVAHNLLLVSTSNVGFE